MGAKVRIVCQSNKTKTFIAGAKYDKVLEPFDVRKAEIDLVQYGSDETKTSENQTYFGRKSAWQSR